MSGRELVLEIVCLIAIAHVWARGSIFKSIREWGSHLKHERCNACRIRAFWRALADCPLCSGCWIGWLGHELYLVFPNVVVTLGIGALVGTGSLATYGAIRRL